MVPLISALVGVLVLALFFHPPKTSGEQVSA
jgi:hypothetical protein